ncbi:MAG TPA: GNAT family N-acetyltransferase [Acidimicrobiales bacterium]|nr:GNAT family N-acetyltransferase [Acidimicrobiales bacterium]
MIEVRRPRPHEVDAYAGCVQAAFAVRLGDRELAELVGGLNEHCLAAYEGGELVGTLGGHLSLLTLPGAARLPLLVLQDVAVLPTHRRRGVLTAMMAVALEQARRSGTVLLALQAGAGSLYGRYGFGPACFAARYRIRRGRGMLRPALPAPAPAPAAGPAPAPAPAGPAPAALAAGPAPAPAAGPATAPAARAPEAGGEEGRVRLLSAAEALEAFPLVHEAYCTERSGEVARPPEAWPELLGCAGGSAGPARSRPLAHRRSQLPSGGERALRAPLRYLAAYEHSGELDGYAVYDLAYEQGEVQGGGEGGESLTLRLIESCAATIDAYRGLWAYLLGLEPEGELVTGARPLDEPLRHLLLDPRALRVDALADRTWLRLVDVSAVLGARRYAGPGRLALRVEDPACSSNAGRYDIVVGDDGAATVERPDTSPGGGVAGRGSRAVPTLDIDIAGLAAAVLGGTTFAELAAAGRAVADAPASIAVADALFACRPLPFCTLEL